MPPGPQNPFANAFAPWNVGSGDPSSSSSSSSSSGSDIVDAARKYGGSLGYKLYSYGNGTPSGQAKDHHFVADALGDVGYGFGDDVRNRPAIADWTNPSSSIPGFSRVTDGSVQAGDVLASAKPVPKSWYQGNGQYLRIATGNGTSLSIVDNDRIGESRFGFQDGHNPLVWRADSLASDSGLSAAPNTWYGSSTVPDGMVQLADSSGRKGPGKITPPQEIPPGAAADCPPLVDGIGNNWGQQDHNNNQPNEQTGPWNGTKKDGSQWHCEEPNPRWPWSHGKWKPGHWW